MSPQNSSEPPTEPSSIAQSPQLPYVFLRSALAGILSAALELFVFWLLWPRPAYVFARVASAGLNYWLLRNYAFRSRQPIAATLPRYLALAAASALLSATGVRAFTASLAWNPVLAKAAVDSLLFFANFTIERLLIFLSDEDSLPRRFREALALALTAVILVCTTGAEIYGFIAHKLFSQSVWMPWGLHRYTHFAGLFAAWSFVVLLFAPWGYAAFAVALLTAATVAALGPLPVLAVAFFLIAACALGSRILGRHEPDLERDVLATLLGVAIYVFAFTLVARIPVNTPLVWSIALAIPIAFDWRGALQRLRNWLAFIRRIELRSIADRLAFALLLFAVAAQWAGVLSPEISADGLGIHLAVPANIAAHHAFTYQPNDLVWSVMPLAADFAYSIVYLFGGEPAPSLLNFTMLLAIAALLYYATRRSVTRPIALLLTALFVSTPLVQLATGSLFVENFVTALAIGALAAFWRSSDPEKGVRFFISPPLGEINVPDPLFGVGEAPLFGVGEAPLFGVGEAPLFGVGGAPLFGVHRRLFLAAAILAGAAIAAKLGAWAVVLIAAPFAIAEARRRRIGRTAWLAAALLLAFAIPPYAIAYLKTGNPVFPFLNDKIPSNALPHGILVGNDGRYAETLNWLTPFDLTFRTNDFFESQDGGMGFEWLLLIPLTALALFVMRNRRATTSGAIALFAGTIIFLSKPNARYLYTVLPLFVIAFAGMLEWLRGRRRLRAALLAFTIAVAGLNLYFLAASSWYRKDFYSPLLFRPGGREAYLKSSSPIRYLAREFRRQHPHDHVLMIGDTDLADIGDGAYQYLWHQFPVWWAIVHAQRAPELRRVLRAHDIHYVTYAIPNEDDDLIQPSALREYLSICADPILREGRFYVSHIDPRCEAASDNDIEAEIARMPPPIMAPGTYDDFHNGVVYHGDWTRSRYFAEPYHHTVSYSDDPEAYVRFAFAGDTLTYVHTYAANRAIADLVIDGVSNEIDGYAPTPQWKAHTVFHLSYGQHVITLRSTGRANPASQGKFIDLDAFIAK